MRNRRKFYTAEKVHLAVLYVIRISLIIAIIAESINKEWLMLLVSCAAFMLTFLPALVEKRFKVDLPVEVEFITIIFIYATIFLGEVRDYYVKIWWWDFILHSAAGIALGFVGFMILYVMHKGDKIKASPSVIAFFSICFAIAIGGIWEIFEFVMDQSLGLNMQKNGLVDTMWDLIANSIGALISSFLGYFYIKNGKMRFFGTIMNRFEKDNPELFDAKK